MKTINDILDIADKLNDLDLNGAEIEITVKDFQDYKDAQCLAIQQDGHIFTDYKPFVNFILGKIEFNIFK